MKRLRAFWRAGIVGLQAVGDLEVADGGRLPERLLYS